jgi:para-aminobenzoate synthetase component 1
VAELAPAPQPVEVFSRLAGLPHCLFLDSALRVPTLGRYSFLAADPVELFTAGPHDAASLEQLGRRLAALATPTRPELPPFQGGAAGLLSYDLLHQLEQVPAPRSDEFGLPVLAMGLYDVVVAFDHAAGRAWLISQGIPEIDPQRRRRRATQRLEEFRDRLSAPVSAPRPSCRSALAPRSLADLAPQFPLPSAAGILSNFSREAYLAAVQRVIDYIAAGDVFQVNLAQRLLSPAREDSVSLYLRLRQCNPAPFAGYFDLGDFQIASASPERFLRVAGRRVETRPIKGTRRRSGDRQLDRQLAAELRASQKDRAENVMIVDLLRNDLSRVCVSDSVRVSQLCEVETYQHVLHLVSAVCGELAPQSGPLDLVQAAFPGGSVTGAPKIRAMEIIAELEPTARGAYCGCLGYVGLDGALDLNILIRTITAGRGWWQAPVGGGIVAASLPDEEYQETLDKAEGLLRAMAPGPA